MDYKGDFNNYHSFDIKSLFLGSQSENSELFKQLVNITLNSVIETRIKVNGHMDEPIFSKDHIESGEYIYSKQLVIQKTNEMLEYLKRSIQFSSNRTMSYMFGDTTIPSIIGNIAALCYNSTNLIYQLSNTTTPLEYIVIKDLVKLIGFKSCNERVISFNPISNEQLIEFQHNESLEDTINGWGHLTSGGSISNIEAYWASFLNKFLAISIKQALLNEQDLIGSKNITIKTKYIYSNDYINFGSSGSNSSGLDSIQLISLSNWDLLNIDIDQVVRLPFQIANENNMKYFNVINLIKKYHPINTGIHSFVTQHGLNLPIFIAPKSAHYSFSKASSILGLGIEKGLKLIDLDSKNRMSISHLKRTIKECSIKRIPILNCTCIIGSTVEGIIDPLDKVLELRNYYRNKKIMDWFIHSDGAYGALFMTCIKDEFPMDQLPNDHLNIISSQINNNNNNNNNNNSDSSSSNSSIEGGLLFNPELLINKYIVRQFKCLKYCESITLDYHKHGFINFSTGGILFRNEKFKYMLSMVTVYIDGLQFENLGTYGIEGSRGSQSAAAVYLTNSIIRPCKSGYGRLLSLSQLNSKLFYLGLLCFNEMQSSSFKVVTLSEPPSKKIFNYLIKRIFNISTFNNNNSRSSLNELGNEQDDEGTQLVFPNLNDIKWDSKLIKLLSNVGSDLNIVCFTVNSKSNSDYQHYIKSMEAVTKRFSILNAPNIDLLLSSTSINESLNQNIIGGLLDSLGITTSIPTKNISIPFIRSITIDPFSTQTIKTSTYTNIFKLLNNQLNKIFK